MSARHRVVALCLEGLVAFDLTAPAQAFGLAARPSGEPLYEFSTCSVGGAEVRTTSGFGVSPAAGLGALRSAGTIVVPAYAAILEPPHEDALAGLRAAARRGARVLSVCSGAFALAHAGLLDGRRAATHWAWAGELARRFPSITVDPDALYVDEGEVMTSAGLSAGIDLSLHVIRKDFGAAAGEQVARHMVAAPHREGGQAQFAKRAQVEDSGSLEATRRWAAERLEQQLDVAAMSGHAGVSPRTFARRFREETGTTPLQWVLSQRVLEARRLLEESDLPVETVAWRCGFGSAASLRDHFRRATATTPTSYRRSFSPKLPAAGSPGSSGRR
ncbi:MAG TPA: helix-turn-helix domain-containing protein [Solirubrobacterales bacterium]|nr:helix-turn-helix domain-containing protein [Solirubrobacterales bacterium]